MYAVALEVKRNIHFLSIYNIYIWNLEVDGIRGEGRPMTLCKEEEESSNVGLNEEDARNQKKWREEVSSLRESH